MNYKEKKLTEFDIVSVYWFSNKNQYNINKEECRDFLAESIQQAIAEERERVDKEITKQFKYASENDNYDMRGVDWQSILHPSDILSSLDT